MVRKIPEGRACSRRGIVAGARGDDGITAGGGENDGVKGAVGFELCGHVNEGVAVARGVVDFEDGGGEVGNGGLLVEDAAASELGDGAKGFLADIGTGALVVEEGVDGGLALLTFVYDVLGKGMAPVVDAVGEKDDDVGGTFGAGSLSGNMVTAGAVEGVPEGCAAEAGTVFVGDVGGGLDEQIVITGPILLDLGLEVEAKDHGLIAIALKGGIGDAASDDARGEDTLHGVAHVKEDGYAKGKIVVVSEEGDAGGGTLVVEEKEIGRCEVGDGAAGGVVGMEGEGNLIGVQLEDVGFLRAGE